MTLMLERKEAKVVEPMPSTVKEAANDRRARRTARRRAGLSFGLRWAVFAAALVLWQVATTVWRSPYFPSPLRIAEKIYDLWIPKLGQPLPPGLAADVAPSLARMGIGLAIAVVAGIVLGVLIGLSKRLEGYLDWILQFFRAVPPPTLFPVFLLMFGVSDNMRIILIAFGSVWPILLNTIEGVRSIPTLTFEAARTFRLRPGDTLFRIILPAAAPKILAGIRTSLALGIILMVISEMVATTNGIGFQLIQAQRTFLTLDMWAAIALLGILGYALNLLLTIAERRILLWQRIGGKETS